MSDNERRAARAELAALRSSQRAHDRQFTRAARAGRTDELDELADESDQRWREFERMADELLRERP